MFLFLTIERRFPLAQRPHSYPKYKRSSQTRPMDTPVFPVPHFGLSWMTVGGALPNFSGFGSDKY
jgi:hypothetical protein